MTAAPAAPEDVLEEVSTLGPPGTPVTTPEVAEGFECTQRTIYNRLESLVDDGSLETKKVGAKSRVWWRPIDGAIQQNGGTSDHRAPVSLRDGQAPSFRSDSEMAERIRKFEWAETSLGPMNEWPPALRTAVDIMLGASEAIGIYWGDKHTLLYNDAAVEQIGKKHPEALGQPARDVFPEVWDELGPIHDRVLAGDGPVRIEEHYLPLERTGEPEDIWWDSTFNPIPTEDGSVGGVFNISFDVTERVQAERELCDLKRKSEAKYRTLFESIDEGFCIIEMLFDEDEQPVDYRFLETNPTFEEITDLPDVEGERMRDLVPDHEDHWFEIYGKVAKTGESVRFTERAEHIGDRWYDVYAFRIGDPDEHNVAILSDDITERKQTEDALQEREAELTAELAATRELQDISTQLIGEDDVEALSERVLDAAVEIVDADFASVQLYDPDRNDLELVAHRGFTREAEAAWKRVTPEHGTTCGMALRTGERVVVSDVETDDDVVATEELKNYRQTGIRSMQTTPLVSRSGDVLGMFSTHWETPHDPSEPELGRLDVLARQAADLLENQKAADALRESEARFDAFVTATSEVVYRMSPDWSQMYYLDGKDFIVDTEEPRETWLEEYIPPDEEQRVMAAIEEAIETKSTFELEHQVVQADGTRGWAQSRAVPVLDDDGDITEWFGAATDITERKQREKALRKSEQRLTAAVNAAEIGIWELDLQTHESLYISPRYAEILGYDEVPGDWNLERALEHYHPEDHERLATYLEEGLGEREFESRIIRADGEERWISVESTVYEDSDGTPVRAVGTMLDITERKEREKKLRESEEKYRALFDTMDEGACLIELTYDEDEAISDLTFQEVNDSFERQTGLQDAAGKTVGELLPNFKQYWIDVYSHVAETGESVSEQNYVEDVDRWYDTHFSRLGDEESQLVAVVFNDITERKETEQKLHQQAELDAFRINLADAIRSLTDPVTVQQEAARVLGEQLNATRANYCEVLSEDGRVIVHSEYLHGDTPTALGEHRLNDFGQHILESLHAGNSVVVDDLRTDPQFTEEQRTSYSKFDIRSLVAAPIIKGGQCTAYVVVNVSTPREWTDTEIEMVEETAERTWAAVERAQAEQALRESREKLEIALEAAQMGTWQWNLDARTVDGDERFLELFDLSNETGPIPIEDFTARMGRESVDDVEAVTTSTFEPGEYIEGEVRLDDVPDAPVWLNWRARASKVDPSVLVGVSFDITERKEREKNLRESEARLAAELEALKRLQEVSTQSIEEYDADALYESVLDTTIDLLDADFGTIQRLDPQAHELDMLSYRGFTAETIAQWDRVDAETASNCGKALQTEARVIVPDVETSEFIEEGEDLEAFTRIGIRSMQSTPLISRSGELLGMISTHWTDTHEPSERDLHLLDVIARQVADLMEQRAAYEAISESEAALERLNAATQELIDAEPETIADRVAPLVREVLDVEYAALWQYDDQRGYLDEYAADVAPALDGNAVEFPTEIIDQVWETFVGTDVDVANDLEVLPDVTSPVRSCALVPLGRHGVVCLGSTGVDTFDERTVDLMETVASTVETAWNRADSEETLARQNEELARLDRLNTLIRSLDQALVGADTREAIDEAVCEQLANSDLYESAWIATYDAETDSLRPQAWAGVDSGYLEDRAATIGDASSDDPLVAAHRTQEMQVVSDIAVDARASGWREAVLERGARSCIKIPLVYGESMYGILTVYGQTPQPDEREMDVLGELSGTIAHAIHALEATTTRRTDSVVELTLRTTKADTPLVRLARELNCVIEFEGLVPRADTSTTVFFTTRDVSPEEVVAADEQLLAIEELSHVADRETGALFKARLDDATLPERFLEQNAMIQSLRIDAETVTAVVELAETADIREFIESLERDVPDLDLLSRQTRTREPEATLQSTVLDRLTPRQQEVLQLAYRSGYFEMPRVQSGKELADVLDIVPSTFTKHIRNAERTVLDVIFTDEHGPRELEAK